MSISAAARVAGINRSTWGAVERGERETEDYTYGAIERALNWEAGKAQAILAQASASTKPPQATGDSQFDALIAWLTRVANNPNREPHIRAIARAQIEQAIALRDADQAEGRARGEAV
ncbi:hypothetical protein ABZ949_02735 [Micromonospora tulbaghiae]|uniref:hypothetical protein n=1 Tax=Micromonospora tulbaghiae TaxID=479978 RepID=UPI0033DCA8F2